MIIKALKWTLLTGLLLVLCGGLYLHFSARAALDKDYTYTAAAAALPEFEAISADGLVRIAANGMDFRARVAGFDGKPDKPAVILLHGFPTTSAMYLDLIQPLANAGYRVLAPDQRGYSPAARPEGAENYTIPELTADVLALADAAGLAQFHLVGHDWGAAVGWSVVLNHPERVLGWSALSIAHPAAFAAALANDPDQQARSRYFLLFVTPWLAESLFSFNNFALMNGMYQTMSATQSQEYLALLREPGALTAAFNWYRAAMAGSTTTEELALTTTTPTVFVWGNEDGAVGRYSVEQQAQYMEGPYQEIELDADHWLFRSQPRQTVAAILEHIRTNHD